MKAVETTEAHRRGLLLTPEAQTRGLHLMAEAKIVIDQLQNDLDLIEMMRVPFDNPIARRGEPSGSEPIQLEGITGTKTPEIPPPQIGSPGGIST
jgi:hypothetical protein